jgi:hypothetical protein
MDKATAHPSTQQLLQWFEYDHLPPHLQYPSRLCADLAAELVRQLPNGGPELTAGLRKLLEAKDCFVRASIIEASLVAPRAQGL